MESGLAAAITGVLTLIGVLIFYSRSRAVMGVKLETLNERVWKHIFVDYYSIVCTDWDSKMQRNA